MTDIWRYACPEDHRTVTRRGNKKNSGMDRHWYCATCNARYSEIRDLKTGRRVEV